MKTDNKVMLLRDAGIEPNAEVLEKILGAELYPLFMELQDITANELGLEPLWRYYNDGKAWLCKVVDRKKTVFWLSIWEGFIKTSFFFTEKTAPGIFDLPISDKVKEVFRHADTMGKLIPLILDMNHKEQLADFREIAAYKKNLK